MDGRGSNGLDQIYQRGSFKTHTSWLSSLAALVNIRGQKGRHAPFKEHNYSSPSLLGIELVPGDTTALERLIQLGPWEGTQHRSTF